MPDVAGFRRALGTLTRKERSTLERRCAGLGLQEMAEQDGMGWSSQRNRLLRLYEKMRAVPDIEPLPARNITEALCYRLGYEQALADIEAQVARKRAA